MKCFVGRENPIKYDSDLTKKRIGVTRWLCSSRVIRLLALMTSAIVLLNLYNKHTLMTSGCFLMPAQMTHFFILLMRFKGFCWNFKVNSVYTDFSKVFDRVCHQLLLKKMSVGIKRA
jgi:hypothetical protein